MPDPTPVIDWYPASFRPKEAQPGSPWDRYEAAPHVSRLQPDPFERNEALRALNETGSWLYVCRVAGGLIKIGVSRHLVKRRWQLGGEFLALSPGGRVEEQALHDRLGGHLHHGREWYYPTPGVLTVVNEMRASVGMDTLTSL